MPAVTLKYNRSGLRFEFPETPGFVGVLEPRHQPALQEPMTALQRSLEDPIDARPLREIAHGRRDAIIVISDDTRPVPNALLLPPILSAIESGGVASDRITILIATGMHRPNEGAELEELIGADIARRYRVINHQSRRSEDMVYVGEISGGAPVYVNRAYVEADLKVLTGFIEAHMWAGYSGGRKSILPGISSEKTLKFMHGPEMVADPNATYAKLVGNPFHEAGLQVMDRVGADFIVNVTLNTSKEVTGIYSGHPVTAHTTGASAIEPYSSTEVDEPLDFVVTTNSGAPLDVNLYQTSKCIAGVGPVMKTGGDIIVASSCPEGLGGSEFVAALNEFTTPEEWIQRALAHDFFYNDQWCAQEIFKWMIDHPIHLYSDGISDEETKRYGMHPVKDLRDTVDDMLRKHGEGARWAIIPDGPLLVLRLKSSKRILV
ncbi:MAG: nickel-dependent lactate racemase [Spirochaetaceae bacterium]|nr:MAG: nickel-dependent lactate racemase [Spirochaetaceae bacterium]